MDAGSLPPFLRRKPGAGNGASTPDASSPADVPPVTAATSGGDASARKSRGKGAPHAVAPALSALPARLPSLDLLSADGGIYAQTDAEELAGRIEEVMGELGIPVRVVHVESGPTVTQFGVEPLFLERGNQRRKVRVSQITALADDLALALATPSVRMEAPVSGRNYVGIEIPNLSKSLVSLRGIVESAEFTRLGGQLALPLGRNTSGGAVVMDLSRAPHMLIAGATGSGKSVCINTIIMGLILRHGPDSLRLIMVDPKRVELAGYGGIPHLMGQVITDVEKVMPALTWLTLQMDDRYSMFREVGVRHLEGYNEWVRAQPQVEGAPQPLPYLVLIVDELADLMMTAPEDIERLLCRLAQKARATGIHLILATQRP
ncbi:MAG: DNA translocase FtsK, partial [Caldilineaceae bacterium]